MKRIDISRRLGISILICCLLILFGLVYHLYLTKGVSSIPSFPKHAKYISIKPSAKEKFPKWKHKGSDGIMSANGEYIVFFNRPRYSSKYIKDKFEKGEEVDWTNQIFLMNRRKKILWQSRVNSIWDIKISRNGEYVLVSSESIPVCRDFGCKPYSRKKLINIFYLFDKEGKLLWKKEERWSKFQPFLSSDGSLVFVKGEENEYYIWNQEGKQILKNKIKGWLKTISDNGGSLITFEDNNVNMYDKSGRLLWKYPLEDGISLRSIATSFNGSFTAISTELKESPICRLLFIGNNGRLLWSYDISSGVPLDIKLSANGQYLVAIQSKSSLPDKIMSLTMLYFNAKGDLLWKFEEKQDSPADTFSSFAISKDGSYIAVISKKLKHHKKYYKFFDRIYFFNQKGEMLWYAENENFYRLEVSEDGKYILAKGPKSFYLYDNANIISTHR